MLPESHAWMISAILVLCLCHCPLRSVLNAAARVVLLRCNSDHVTHLHTVLQRKSQSLHRGLKALQSGSHYFCDLISYDSFPSVLSASATLVSLPFHEHTGQASSTRHLPFMFPPPGMLFPKSLPCLLQGSPHHSLRYFHLTWLLLLCLQCLVLTRLSGHRRRVDAWINEITSSRLKIETLRT